MKFYKAVQSEEIVGPLRRGFKVQEWKDAYHRLQDDDDDLNLFNAGLLIHSKANEIRSGLKITFSKDLNATTKLRSFVAIANYNFCMLQNKTREVFDRAAEGIDTVLLHEFAAIKLKLGVGAEFSPDEIAESIVDGTQVPIKVVLQGKPQLGGNPRYKDFDWAYVNWDSNMGILYSHLESLWDDCLWNDFRVRQDSEGNVFLPNDPIWQYRLTASRFRHDGLVLQFMGMSKAMLARIDREELHLRLGVRDVTGISKNGRKQVIRLASPFTPTEDGVALLAARLYATEPYYMELLHEPRQALGGASLNDLLGAWTVISRTAAILREEIKGVDVPEDSKPNSWLPRFVPVMQIDALAQAIAGAVNTQLIQARAILEFLIFRGEDGQELWAQPLVPISLEGVSPIFAATTSPNLGRLVDIWMGQIGIDLGLRGPAFEDYVNLELRKDISSSPLLKEAKVTENGMVFRPPEDRVEQIDTVLVIGDLVILGESKCILHPAESKQIAMHRKTVNKAVAQVKRKASSVEKYSESFRIQLRLLGIELPEKFRILPVVILNGSIHSGFEVDGVPVVDLYIFNVFFSGELIDMAHQHADGHMESIKKRILYSDAYEASKVAPEYFSAPPQMEIMLSGIKERWVPVARISNNDWSGLYLTFECQPQVEKVM